MADVVKKVGIDYVVQDHAAGPLGRIAHEANKTGGAVERLKDRFKEFRGETVLMAAGVLGIGVGLGSWIEKAKQANQEFGGAQKSIASTMATILDWPRTMAPVEKFTRSMGMATSVVNVLDDKAAEYGMQLTDLAGAYKTIGVSAAPLKLSQKQWLDLSIESAAAAKQFGISGEEAADTIGKALVSKSIRPASDLGKFLKNEIGGNLHKLNNAQILDKMNKALSQSTKIAEQMGLGMGGAIARIQNVTEDLFRDVTGPLFKEIAKDVDSLAKRMREGTDSGKSLTEVVAGRLLTGFREVRDAAGFIADHWKTIALVVGGMKLTSTVGQLGEIAKGIRDVMGNVGRIGAGAGGAGGLMGMAAAIGPVIAGLAAFKIGLDAVIDFVDKKVDATRARHEGAADVTGALGTLGRLPMGPLTDLQRKFAGSAMDRLGKGGLVSGGKVNASAVRETWKNLEEGEQKSLAGSLGFKVNPYMPFSQMNQGPMIRALVERVESLQSAYGGLSRPPLNAAEGDASRKTTGKPQVLFTGANNWALKFDDVDPDRFMLRFKDDMENYVGRRTSSVLSDPFED